MSKVTAKYQITIPLKVRTELGIVPGTEVDVIKEDNKYVLIVEPLEGVRNKWQGRFKDETTTMDYLDQVRGKVS